MSGRDCRGAVGSTRTPHIRHMEMEWTNRKGNADTKREKGKRKEKGKTKTNERKRNSADHSRIESAVRSDDGFDCSLYGPSLSIPFAFASQHISRSAHRLRYGAGDGQWIGAVECAMRVDSHSAGRKCSGHQCPTQHRRIGFRQCQFSRRGSDQRSGHSRRCGP